MRLTIDEARTAVLEHVAKLTENEQVALDDALGRVLAVDVSAPNDVPPFDCSSMDGYALRAGDSDDAPVSLEIVDEARAGAGAQLRVEPGQAVRISTGAPIPAGADAVIRQELTEAGDGSVLVKESVPVGNDVRSAGGDIAAGEIVLRTGMLIGPAEIGVLASVNVARPLVVRRPRIALIGTGDELVETGGGALAPGEIRDSNGPALTAGVRVAGGEVITRTRVGDDRQATVDALGAAMEGADVLLTVGGVSVGPHDHVRPALEELGARQIFARVSLRPGGQVCFYVAADGTLAFALPGNPVSANVAFRLFVVPTLDALLGRGRNVRRAQATVTSELRGSRGRTVAVRCQAELRSTGWFVTPVKSYQDSHVLTSMLGVDAFAFVPADRDELRSGEQADVEFVS